MKVTGIIAEYNPFHNGHKYHIEKAKELTDSDYCIVVMSGNFTQRGEPALIDKYIRSEMALINGADLVLELPTCYACSSAPYFAEGAVALLDKLGVTDYIAFGSECGDISMLQKTARILTAEPESYSQALKSHLKSGLSYPAARLQALNSYDSTISAELLSSPNNILGLEYCKALIARKSSITPLTITRCGGGYSDDSLQPQNSSALAIRTALQTQMDLETIQDHVPHSVYPLLQSYYQKSFPVFPDMLSAMLHYKLLSQISVGFTEYLDISEDLSDRICNKLPSFTDFTSFCAELKTKELTYTRISRGLLHILLDIKKESLAHFCANDWIFYGRILGFRQESTGLLSSIKENASIPMISKLADAFRSLEGPGIQQLQKDIQAAHIYNALIQHTYHTKLPVEMQRQIIRK